MARTKGAKNIQRFKWDNGRKDNWHNTLTALGTSKDKSTYTTFGPDKRISYQELDRLYQSDGFTKKIVDFIPDEMTRGWFHVTGDPQNKILSYLESIDAKEKINNLLTWSRLYGGAIAIIGADDGLDLDEPLNKEAIKSIDFLHVFDRSLVNINTTDLYLDPKEKKYGKPKRYYVTPYYTGKPFYVHESRVLRLDGDKLPIRLQAHYEHWGMSVVESVYTELKDLGAVYGACRNIVDDFVQTIIKIEDLGQKIEDGQDDYVKARMDIMDMSRHLINTIFLDSAEEYQKQSSSVSGLPELLEKFTLKLASVSKIAYAFLAGQSPSGLQATGATDTRMTYDLIAAKQNDNLLPILEYLINLILLADDFDGNISEDWSIKFNPLWQQTENEIVQTRKAQAETDAIYIDRGVLDREEVAASRFGGESYSINTTLSDVED